MRRIEFKTRSVTRRVRVIRVFGAGVTLALAMLWQAVAQTSPQAAAGGRMRRARVHVLLSPSFFRGIDRHDVIAAFKPWFDIIAQERGLELDSHVDVPADHLEIEKRLRQGAVDVLMLDFVDYVRLEPHGLLVADLTEQRGSDPNPGYSYLVLTRAESGIHSIADLQEKALRHYARTKLDAGLAWLDVTMAKAGLGRAASHAGARKPAARPQDCVLPVFFGKVDACVVDELSFELLKEMNPQLTRLRVIARSERFIETVIARPVVPHPYMRELWDATISLHLNPRGKQVLTMFQVGRVVRLAPEHMAASRRLWQEYRKLHGSLPSVQGLAAGQPASRSGVPAAHRWPPSDRTPPGAVQAWRFPGGSQNAAWSAAAGPKGSLMACWAVSVKNDWGSGVRRGPGSGAVWEGWTV
ncbi:MAG: PhnD/SsuA/transferrin family substrate-binding protein [Bryobacterales bacterium]|nr:PhnD/SsuA/transferrin family substrate-binding protein [Bryobacterales bacterium]